ncbi:MAG: ABC transporter permease [Oscillospiraceae bacterium]|nr:ABC transporter permease [Oscillospiraceae bacterium]
MFWNIYSKRILYSLRSKDTLIWTWIFPIMLATLFFATLSAVDTAGLLHEIPLGVINNDASFLSMLESVSGEDDNRLFDLTVLQNIGEADELLENGKIDGYIFGEGEPALVVAADGLNQTIIKNVLEAYLQTKNAVGAVMIKNPGMAEHLPALLEPVNYTKEISLSENPPTDKVNYYYALLAMICLYGGFQGLTTITLSQANLSPLGARRTMAPAGRFKVIFYDLLGSITVHFCCLLIVVAYIIFVLGADFGSKLWLVLLTCFAGSVLGVAFGAMVAVASKLKEQAKVAILISVTMMCCFLSGLMVGGINYIVMQNAPAAAWLNPAARITDAFYCLYYYDTYDRYIQNIAVVLLMAVVMFAVTSIFVRRQRYESI